MIDNNEPDFMHKTDATSLARACRLAYVQSVFRQGMIEKDNAIELLKGSISKKYRIEYDDSRFLKD